MVENMNNIKNMKNFLQTIEPLAFFVFNIKRLRHRNHRKHLDDTISYVSRRTSKPKSLVGIDLFIKCFAACALYAEYTEFHLYNRTFRDARRFCGFGRQVKALRALKTDEAARVFDIKPLFHKVFNRFTKRDYLFITDATSDDVFEQFLKRHPAFIAKPPMANAGRGVWLVDGNQFGGSAEILATLRKRGTTLIEERVKNHPVLDRFSRTSLNTMRLITLRLPEGIKLIGAFLKFNTTGGITDNVADGNVGYVCPIDIDTGRIVNVMKKFYGGWETINYSPDGFDVPGTKIPYWEEAVEMVREATTVLPGAYFVPWDVAVSPEGPLIIEGNNVPGFTFQDMHNRPCNKDMQRARRYAKSTIHLKFGKENL